MAVDGRGLQAAGGRDRLAPPGIGGDDRRPADAGEPGDRAEDPIEAPALQRDVVDVGDQARAGRGVNGMNGSQGSRVTLCRTGEKRISCAKMQQNCHRSRPATTLHRQEDLTIGSAPPCRK